VLDEKGSQEDHHTFKSLKVQMEETNDGWVINFTQIYL
jgi:hypothetical protein